MAMTGILKPHSKDLGGGFIVRRSLPGADTRAIGPFIFFDHFGPVIRLPSDNFDVRPHPHIGLATVTYLFEGAMLHRDNLGYEQRIEPGAINWMTAGRGIVHSERGPADLRDTPYPIHGLQLWSALPRKFEECEPAFAHTPAEVLPQWRETGWSARVLIGSMFGLTSPVRTYAETVYIDFDTARSATIDLPAATIERGIYLVNGTMAIDGRELAPMQLAVLDTAATRIDVSSGARFVLIGGEPLDGYRFMWWNFVSSRRERIEQAKQDWVAQRMGTIPGETEFIPLPE